MELLDPKLPMEIVEAAASALRHLCARNAGASDLLIAGGAVPLVVRLLAHAMHHHHYVIIMVGSPAAAGLAHFHPACGGWNPCPHPEWNCKK